MIAELRGKVVFKSSTESVILCNGVGYLVNTSLITSEKIPSENEDVRLFTILIPREDALNLYGFFETSEREAFKILISISGVGPKVALGILSSLSVDELQHYILQGNIIALQKLPGIGKKTAERLILELKDKVIKLGDLSTKSVNVEHNMIKQEALSALLTLGYSRPIAEKAVRRAVEELAGESSNAEKIIKLSLKFAIS